MHFIARKVLHLAHRQLGQLGDFLDEVDRADHKPHLGILVFFAAVVRNANKAVDVQFALVLVGDGRVVGAPGDATRKVRDLNRGLAIKIAFHIPIQHLRLAMRKGCIEHVQFIGGRQKLQIDRRWVDLRVRPRELQWVHALLKRNDASFAHQRNVLAVVDRELDGVAPRNRRQIDVFSAIDRAESESCE